MDAPHTRAGRQFIVAAAELSHVSHALSCASSSVFGFVVAGKRAVLSLNFVDELAPPIPSSAVSSLFLEAAIEGSSAAAQLWSAD
jgi:hypothetical protein